MPRVTPVPKGGRRKFRDGELVMALEAGYTEAGGTPFYWRTGDRLTADHAAVRQCPGSFCPADLPSDEIAAWLPDAPEAPRYESDFNIREPTPIAAEDQVVCVEFVGTLTRSAKPGQVLDRSDPLVRAAPQNFCWHRRLTAEDVA